MVVGKALDIMINENLSYYMDLNIEFEEARDENGPTLPNPNVKKNTNNHNSHDDPRKMYIPLSSTEYKRDK